MKILISPPGVEEDVLPSLSECFNMFLRTFGLLNDGSSLGLDVICICLCEAEQRLQVLLNVI